MSIETVPPAIVVIGEGVSGILTAKDPPPAQIDTAQLPCLFVFTGEASCDWELLGDPDVGVESRTYRVQVAVVPRNQATPETRETRCRPLIGAVRDALASRPSLGGVTGVLNSVVTGDSGVAILPEYEAKFIGFEVRLEVTEIIARTYSAGE